MILQLRAFLVEKLWAGTELNDLFKINKRTKIGEAWLASGYFEHESMIVDSNNNSIKLSQFYQQNKELFNNYPSNQFPLLIKFIAADQDLSLQVHPNDQQAKLLEKMANGKYEGWVILKTLQKQKIIIGTKLKDKEKIKNYFKNNQWSKVIEEIDIFPGDVFEIKPGTLHAIKSGTFLYEIQQPSDITYRLYDYQRKDGYGKERKLDLEKGMEVLNLANKTEKISFNLKKWEKGRVLKLMNNKYFTLSFWEINETKEFKIDKKRNFLIITVILGCGMINDQKVEQYQSFILTNDELPSIKIKGNLKLLVANPN